jgi:hypothetical protein
MKEATGELNMTVVTLIAVAALGAVFYFAVWPLVQRMLIDRTCKTYGNDFHAERVGSVENIQNGQAKTYKWQCCPKGKQAGSTDCIGVNE